MEFEFAIWGNLGENRFACMYLNPMSPSYKNDAYILALPPVSGIVDADPHAHEWMVRRLTMTADAVSCLLV